MSEFWDLMEEYLGDANALTDVRVVVRRLWFYDFVDMPVRVWDGKGTLYTTDGNEWIGTIDVNDDNHHKTPSLQDGRDGSSPTYNFKLDVIDIPGYSKYEVYQNIRDEQWRAKDRDLICYLAIFKEGEDLRPQTPIIFFKDLTMRSPKFSEKVEVNGSGILQHDYGITIVAKDGNFGRTNVPNGNYADAVQKQRAKEHGISVDKSCEYLALLANKTFQIP